MKFIFRLPLKLLGHIIFLLFFLNAWEFASRYEWLNPTFFGRPSGIIIYIFKGLFISKELWLDLSYTVAGTLISFFSWEHFSDLCWPSFRDVSKA